MVITGAGTGSLTLSGTLAQLNALLQGLQSGRLSFLNGLAQPSAGTTLTLSVNDLGNTGGAALTAQASATLLRNGRFWLICTPSRSAAPLGAVTTTSPSAPVRQGPTRLSVPDGGDSHARTGADRQRPHPSVDQARAPRRVEHRGVRRRGKEAGIVGQRPPARLGADDAQCAVSYTHLTLPTSDLV